MLARSDESALRRALYDRFGRDRLRARSAHAPRREAGRGRRAGRVPRPSGATPPVHPGAGKASTWMLTLVHRRAVDLVRREQRRRAEPSTTASTRSPASSRPKRSVAAVRARARPVRAEAAPGHAARGDRARLLRRLHAVRARREARRALGTIKSRMFTGLARLRELLDRPGPGEATWNPAYTS